MPAFPIETLLLFMAAALALNLTPGPDMLFCLGSGAHRGPKAGVAASLGVACGAMMHTAAAAFGLAGLLMASPLLFEIVRWTGAAYLVWLAWNTFRAAPPVADGTKVTQKDIGRIFLRGAITNMLNPKVAIFFLAFLPQFTDPARGSVTAQMFALGGLFILSALAAFSTIAFAAGGISRWLRASDRGQVLLNRVAGLVFVGLAVKLATAER